jgi:Type II CAAX prenyl endopeptidase Rce1-like
VLPLLLGYEISMALLAPPTRNAAEDAVVSLAARLPPEPATWLRRGLLALMLVLAVVLARREAPRVARARWMLVEAFVLALALGPVVGWMLGGLGLSLRPPLAGGAPAWLPFLMSVGAGVWEEIVFRLALLGGLTVLLVRGLKLDVWVATGAAVIVSALAFAAYHHFGALGEPLDAPRFAFRFLAGTILGVLFATRGLAVVVYMHVFYDLLCDVRALHG